MTTMRGFVRQPGLTAFAAFVAAVFLAAPAFAGPIVFSQPAQSPIQSVRASQTQGGLGLVFQTFDNFMLGVDTNIAGVQWLGSYFNSLVIDGSFNPAANATGFAVAFYSDNGLGAPGSLVASQTFSPAGAGQTFVSQQSPTFNSSLGLGVYSYSAALTNPFFAAANTQYWLSVYAISPLASPTQAQWGWNGGSGGNGLSAFSTAGAPTVPVANDRAFALEGTVAVPEPSTLILFGMGIAGALVRGRRRRHVN